MRSGLPLIATERLLLRLATPKDISKIVDYYQENQSFLKPFEPRHPANFLTKDFWQEQVEQSLVEFNYGQSLRLFMFQPDQSERVIGTANFTQFIRGISYNCFLGYSLLENQQGKGYMFEALQAAIGYVFQDLNMHRIMANYMPHNRRSGNLLRRLGFTVEGYARDYLLIDGQWQDHILTSLLNPNWQAIVKA